MEATINVIITDMGNGMRLCSVCEYNLDNGNPCVKVPVKCPGCNSDFVAEDLFISAGGIGDF